MMRLIWMRLPISWRANRHPDLHASSRSFIEMFKSKARCRTRDNQGVPWVLGGATRVRETHMAHSSCHLLRLQSKFTRDKLTGYTFGHSLLQDAGLFRGPGMNGLAK